jgi:uroporphyrinogen-III synthase
VPTIAVVDPPDGGVGLRSVLADLAGYEWVIVTSANGAERVIAAGLTADRLAAAGTRLAVIGPGTAQAIAGHGIEPDLLPQRFVAEGLLEVFPPPSGGRVLLAQAEGARPVLADGLAAAGWPVDRVIAYRTVHPELDRSVADAAVGADVVTFTSASTVTGYVAGVGLDRPPRAVVCIGPVTADAARRAGLRVDAVAEPHTIDGMVSALVELLGADG